MSKITDEIRRSATEFYRGDAICQEKTKYLLSFVGLPNGLLPLRDIEEAGYIEDKGFVWMIQKKKCEHKFETIGRVVQYAKEVTAYIEPNKIRKLTGVKTKELMMWVNLSDISVDDPPTGKITFKTPTGLSRSFPVEAFQIPEPVKTDAEKDEEVKKSDAEDVKKSDAEDVKKSDAEDVKKSDAEEVKKSDAVEVKKEEGKVNNAAATIAAPAVEVKEA